MNYFSSLLRRSSLSLSMLLLAALLVTPSQADAQPAIEVGSETMSQQTVQKRIDERIQRLEQRFGKRLKQKPKLQKKLQERTKKQVVDQIVSQLVLLNHARKAGITVDQSEIEARVNKIKEKNPKGKSFEEALKKAGTTEKEFRQKVEDSLKIKKFVDQEMDTVSVSTEEARQFYDENSKRFKNKSFEQIQDRLVKMLEQRKQGQQMQKLVEELKQKTDITVRI